VPSESRWLVEKSEVVSEHAIVATMHPRATRAGIETLQRGGNAVDAAVAAGFAVGVVEPFNSGLGGIAQLVYRDGRTGRSCVVDGTSTLPRAVRPDTFALDAAGGTAGMYDWPAVVDDANNTGHRSPIVPGMPACLCEAQARFGRLSRADVLAPAIRLAEEGFEVDWYVSLVMAGEQPRLNRCPASRAAYYKPDGTVYAAPRFGAGGDVLRQPDLARSLRLIAEQGAAAVYRGEIARLLAEDMAANGGLIDERDLADYAVRIWEPGLIGDYRGYTTIQAPENTGAPTVLEALNLLEGFDLAALGHNSVEALHLVAEALRRAFGDRFAHLGDPAFAEIPLEGLLSKEYAARRRREIDPARATVDAAAGDPWSFEAPDRPRPAVPSGAAGEGNTTHITVVDHDRNMVSLTSTLGGYFGSAVVARGTGIALNSGATWFDPRPGRVNSLAPGKRVLWAGSPTLVLREGRPFFAVGAPGARKILSAVLQTILNVVDFGLGAQAAVSAPRLHCEGRRTEVDSRLAPDTIEGLRRLGHDVVVKEETFGTSHFARPAAVLIDPTTGHLRGGVNLFNPAMAMGL
jgi:gamma-glutamyltranspeptidase/glutathione hydrolase